MILAWLKAFLSKPKATPPQQQEDLKTPAPTETNQKPATNDRNLQTSRQNTSSNVKRRSRRRRRQYDRGYSVRRQTTSGAVELWSTGDSYGVADASCGGSGYDDCGGGDGGDYCGGGE